MALAMLPAFAAPAHAAGGYEFTKVVDGVAGGFNPQTLRISCPSINTRGDIAFKSDRNNVEGIYRADAGGGVTTIAEAPTDGLALLANANPSMNDFGQVSFRASPSPYSGDRQAIMRGDGTTLSTIASTSTEGFSSFGGETSINDTGEVAFDGTLRSEVSGLFSGTGGPTTTHYLTTETVTVDGESVSEDGNPKSFSAPQDRPSINNGGDIAFLERLQGTSRRDIFRGQEGDFTTISASKEPLSGTPPLLNDVGTVAWLTSFLEAGFFVEAIVKGDGGPTTSVVDSSGAFNLFHSYALNNTGAVAFSATMDEDELGIPSVFAGPDPKKDRVIGPGDKLDDGTVAGLRFCEEGLNDLGQLAFVAEVETPDGEVRAGIFRATPTLKK